MLALVLGLLLCIGWLDYLTTYEVTLLTFYWIPIALGTWYLGARAGFGLAVASVAIAIGTDMASGVVRSHVAYLLWAIFSELLSFGILVWLLARLQQLYLEAQRTSRLEVELQASQAAFEELKRFGYVIGHNWRAPLRSIEGYSQILLDDYGDRLDATAREYVERLRQSGHKMDQLTEALLELIKVSGGELRREPVDLSRLAESIAARLNQRQPEHRVAFTCEAGLRATGDGELLRLALECLMDNAWKFTGQQPEPKVAFGRSQGQGGEAFFLRDNGAGFTSPDASRLFEPYQTAHHPEELAGVGIGLPIAERIVHRHGGRMWAEGAEGKGATFYFTLQAPAAKAR